MKYNTRNRKGDVCNTDTLYLVKKDTGTKKYIFGKFFKEIETKNESRKRMSKSGSCSSKSGSVS